MKTGQSIMTVQDEISDKKFPNDHHDEEESSPSEKTMQIALQELREDSSTRPQFLSQFREWIRQNKDIENCPVDDNFLLRFLRVRKFSLHQAQQTLLKYLNWRRCFPHIFNNMDYLNPKVLEIINSGYMFASPFKDRNGRRVIIYTPRCFDTSKFNSTDLTRVHVITYETLIDDEDNQILGVCHVTDVADGSPSMITMWSMQEFTTLVNWGEQSFPMRHKKICIINLPITLQYIYQAMVSTISQKLRERICMFRTREEMHERVDRYLLPAEYGGVMPMAEMIELWKQELAAKRDRLLSLERIKLLSDQGIICRRNRAHNDTELNKLSGSFRKLEVD